MWRYGFKKPFGVPGTISQYSKKANRIEDIMAVQEKIQRLEEEIDSKEGRLKYLDDQVAYSLYHNRLRWKWWNGKRPTTERSLYFD